MKFLIDESVEYRVIDWLREQQFDVLSISELSPSISDSEVLVKANSEDRVLITNDKDFGELIYHRKLPHKGIILLRLPTEDASSKIGFLQIVLNKHRAKLKGNYVVVTINKIRIKSSHI